VRSGRRTARGGDTEPMWVHLDGRLVPEEEARVSVFDRGFLFGDGIFETLRAVRGRLFRCDQHLERLRRSARLADLELPVPAEVLRAEVVEVLERSGLEEARLRITVTRGPGRPGDLAGGAGPATRVITAAPFVPLEPRLVAGGVAIAVPGRRQMPATVLDPAIKATSRLHLVLARREARARGAFEAVLLDAAGRLTEGTVSNIFLVRGGRLLTPAVPLSGLPGVTRQAVLEAAREAGIDAGEPPLPAAALLEAEEIFLTNTSWEVLPVTRVDGRAAGGGRPGPLTGRLHQLYRSVLAGECGGV
ncbi:MAG: aminotransferase class IV, partial [Candidatus Polarisedimenticolia bacterium]